METGTDNIVGSRAKIVDNAPAYLKALWGKCGIVELDKYGYRIRFDSPVDVGGSIFMETVILFEGAYEVS